MRTSTCSSSSLAYLASEPLIRQCAWGHDDLTPESKSFYDGRNGWGSSIVDALGTMVRCRSTLTCTSANIPVDVAYHGTKCAQERHAAVSHLQYHRISLTRPSNTSARSISASQRHRRTLGLFHLVQRLHFITVLYFLQRV